MACQAPIINIFLTEISSTEVNLAWKLSVSYCRCLSLDQVSKFLIPNYVSNSNAAVVDCVFLNRGNHEDFAICSVYGFQQECYEKYDPITFGLVVEVFQVLQFAHIN